MATAILSSIALSLSLLSSRSIACTFVLNWNTQKNHITLKYPSARRERIKKSPHRYDCQKRTISRHMRHRWKNPVGCSGTAQTKKWVVCVLFQTKKRTTRERASYTPAEYCSWTRRVVDGEQAGESRTRADRSSAVACSPIAIYYRSLTFSFYLLYSQDCRINGESCPPRAIADMADNFQVSGM